MSDRSDEQITVTHRGCVATLVAAFAFLAVTICAAAVTGYVIVRDDEQRQPPTGFTGDPQRGRALVAEYGCTACHEIPGAAPRGIVGPPLTRFAKRAYIAGRFPNEPIALQEWIRNPQRMKPGTAMPDLPLTERDTRDIAAYLATLR